jgi:phosphoribosyl-AMP cyclohydrolase
MNLWVHFLDMVTRDCNLDLIEVFVAKMSEIFCHLELGQVYMEM